jgi:hypothetical protein
MTRRDDPRNMDDELVEWTDLDVERLIRGAPVEEVPDGLGDTAALLAVARGPAAGDEADDRIGAASALASTTSVLEVSEDAPWWRAWRWIAVAAVAAVLVTSGVAAAASHGLISTHLRPASSDASSIDGTGTPDTGSEPAPSTSAEPTTTVGESAQPSTTLSPSTTIDTGGVNGVGPAVMGPALRGLCTAFADRMSQPGSSVAYRNLADAAAVAHQAIQQLCAAVLPPPGQGQANGNQPGRHDHVPPGKLKNKGNGNGQGDGGD